MTDYDLGVCLLAKEHRITQRHPRSECPAEAGDEPGADAGEAGVPERAWLPPSTAYHLRRDAVVEVLRTHNPRPLLCVSPGAPLYGAGLTARCVCGWYGNTQTDTRLPTTEQRGLAEAQCDQHLAEKILERVG